MFRKPLLVCTLLVILFTAATVAADTPPAGSSDTTINKNVVTPTSPDNDKGTTKESSHTKKESTGDPVLSLNKITFATKEARKKRIEQLVKAVEAIEDRGGKPRSKKQCNNRWKKRCGKLKTDADPRRSHKAYRYKLCLRKWKRCLKRDQRWTERRYVIAEAALNAQEKTGVDATFMVAVGRMESDFRNLILINSACKYRRRTYGCYADCGMTQHHVRGPLKYVMRYCKKLARPRRHRDYAKSVKLAFRKSAEELARHVKYCNDPKKVRRHLPTRRCILNRYNQGTFYKRMERCGRCWLNPAKFISTEVYRWRLQDCKKRRRKCRHTAAYWKKLTCFEYGARHAIRSKRSCRRCYSLAKIRTRFYKSPQTGTHLTSFLFKKTAKK